MNLNSERNAPIFGHMVDTSSLKKRSSKDHPKGHPIALGIRIICMKLKPLSSDYVGVLSYA